MHPQASAPQSVQNLNGQVFTDAKVTSHNLVRLTAISIELAGHTATHLILAGTFDLVLTALDLTAAITGAIKAYMKRRHARRQYVSRLDGGRIAGH